jgi:uncharacterized protein (DUF1697 family)
MLVAATVHRLEGVVQSPLTRGNGGGVPGGDPVRCVAFLRGINVGGHKPVKMADLRSAFLAMGFRSVKTVLASGNVVFDVPPEMGLPDNADNAFDLTVHIEQCLLKAFGYPIAVILRTPMDLQRLVKSEPLEGVAVTPDTRLYVTFISDAHTGGPDFSYTAPEGDLRITRVAPGELCSVLVLSPTRSTRDLMVLLEREFGPGITTRSWNTIIKIVRG